jgi:hypothetical protein
MEDVPLLPEDFYETRHELIFGAMRHVHETGAAVDLRTVQARLETLGRFDAVGGIAYLAQLDLDLPDLGRFEVYAGIVKERSLRRQFVRTAQESIRECMEAGADIADLLGRHSAALEEIRCAAASGHPEAVDVEEFLTLDLPPRQWLAAGLIQDRDILMLHAPRGCGKSHFCFGLAYSLACGANFLRYEIARPVPVLLCDGEQQAEEIQARLRAIQRSIDRSPGMPFRLLARDQATSLPSLATPQGQAVVDRLLEQLAPPPGPRVLIIDSLSTLASLPKDVSENDEAGWRPIQDWLLRLRGRGVTSVFVHHDNKAGTPRGTSARETLPSQIVHLKRPEGYKPSEGARFAVYLEKARGVFGPAARPYEAWLQTGQDGRQVWTHRDLGDARDEAIREARAEGITSLRGIVKRTGLPYTTVHRKLKGDRIEGGEG